MRFGKLPCWFPMLVMSLIPTCTAASISVIADLNSDYTDGPDSTTCAPGDTVAINIYFAGTDSTRGFGLILGDTLDVLQWVGEEAADIFNTPGSWTDLDVQELGGGWLQLQSADYTLSPTALVPPHRVATLKFLVTGKADVARLMMDLDESLYLSADSGGTEFTFSSFETPAIAVHHDHPQLFFFENELSTLLDRAQTPPGDRIADVVIAKAAWGLDHVPSMPSNRDTFTNNYTQLIGFYGMAALLFSESNPDSAARYAQEVHDWIVSWVDSVDDWNGAYEHCNRCFTVTNFAEAFDWTEHFDSLYTNAEKESLYCRIVSEVDLILDMEDTLLAGSEIHCFTSAGLTAFAFDSTEIDDSTRAAWHDAAKDYLEIYTSTDSCYGTDGIWPAGLDYGGHKSAMAVAQYLAAADAHGKAGDLLQNEFIKNVRNYLLYILIPTNSEYGGFPLWDDAGALSTTKDFLEKNIKLARPRHAQMIVPWSYLYQDSHLQWLLKSILDGEGADDSIWWLDLPWIVWAALPYTDLIPTFHLPRRIR